MSDKMEIMDASHEELNLSQPKQKTNSEPELIEKTPENLPKQNESNPEKKIENENNSEIEIDKSLPKETQSLPPLTNSAPIQLDPHVSRSRSRSHLDLPTGERSRSRSRSRSASASSSCSSDSSSASSSCSSDSSTSSDSSISLVEFPIEGECEVAVGVVVESVKSNLDQSMDLEKSVEAKLEEENTKEKLRETILSLRKENANLVRALELSQRVANDRLEELRNYQRENFDLKQQLKMTRVELESELEYARKQNRLLRAQLDALAPPSSTMKYPDLSQERIQLAKDVAASTSNKISERQKRELEQLDSRLHIANDADIAPSAPTASLIMPSIIVAHKSDANDAKKANDYAIQKEKEKEILKLQQQLAMYRKDYHAERFARLDLLNRLNSMQLNNTTNTTNIQDVDSSAIKCNRRERTHHGRHHRRRHHHYHSASSPPSPSHPRYRHHGDDEMMDIETQPKKTEIENGADATNGGDSKLARKVSKRELKHAARAAKHAARDYRKKQAKIASALHASAPHSHPSPPHHSHPHPHHHHDHDDFPGHGHPDGPHGHGHSHGPKGHHNYNHNNHHHHHHQGHLRRFHRRNPIAVAHNLSLDELDELNSDGVHHCSYGHGHGHRRRHHRAATVGTSVRVARNLLVVAEPLVQDILTTANKALANGCRMASEQVSNAIDRLAEKAREQQQQKEREQYMNPNGNFGHHAETLFERNAMRVANCMAKLLTPGVDDTTNKTSGVHRLSNQNSKYL